MRRKIAAAIFLLVSLVSLGYMVFVFLENRSGFRAEMAIMACSQLKRQYGPDYVCVQENTTLEYAVSGGIALVALLASLALFRAARAEA